MVSGGKTHFGIGEYEREETVLAPLFGDCEMAREYCELLNKVSNGVEGGIPPLLRQSGMLPSSPLPFR